MEQLLKTGIVLVSVTLIVCSWSDARKRDASYSQVHSRDFAGGVITVVGKWDMPTELLEISGLAHIDKDRFACVQDEMGSIYIYNISTSVIEKEISFAGAGDYEGIALVNDTAWAVRADGRLFEVKDINAGNPVVKEYSTHLTLKQNNIEGLCYDKKDNRLLLAIKDSDPRNVGYKGIYAFDLATRKMPEEPVFKLDLRHEVFNRGSSKKNKRTGIMPSAIAIHPLTGDMYITDGTGVRLLVTDSACNIKAFYQLDRNEFEQPEGITFKPTGELFISNEGVKKGGNILNVKIEGE